MVLSELLKQMMVGLLGDDRVELLGSQLLLRPQAGLRSPI
jgi:hypothetical protein